MQTSIAVVLLVNAVLVATGFARLIQTDPGFETQDVIALRLGRMPPGYSASTPEELAERALQRLRAVPGVHAVTVASILPLERGLNFPIDVADRPELGLGDPIRLSLWP